MPSTPFPPFQFYQPSQPPMVKRQPGSLPLELFDAINNHVNACCVRLAAAQQPVLAPAWG